MSKANYDLPENKLKQVVRLSGAKSKKEAIIIALDEYTRKKKLEKLANSRGKYDLDWTAKKLRKFRD